MRCKVLDRMGQVADDSPAMLVVVLREGRMRRCKWPSRNSSSKVAGVSRHVVPIVMNTVRIVYEN